MAKDTYISFFSILSQLLLSIPLLLGAMPGTEAVLTFGSYMFFTTIILLLLIPLFFTLKNLYYRINSLSGLLDRNEIVINKKTRLMNLLQWGITVLAIAAAIICTDYLNRNNLSEKLARRSYSAISFGAIAAILLVFVIAIVFLVKHRKDRRTLPFIILSGTRNFLLSFICSRAVVYSVSATSFRDFDYLTGEFSETVVYELQWNFSTIFSGILIVAIVIAAVSVLKRVLLNLRSAKEKNRAVQ